MSNQTVIRQTGNRSEGADGGRKRIRECAVSFLICYEAAIQRLNRVDTSRERKAGKEREVWGPEINESIPYLCIQADQ